VAGHLAPGDLDAMGDTLRLAVVKRLQGWFSTDEGRDRTYREVRRFDEPRLDLDDGADAVEALAQPAVGRSE